MLIKEIFVRELLKFDLREVVFITPNLGYKVLDPLRSILKERFIDCGVAEQLAIGLAVGFAKSGFLPIVYTICPFFLRAYEQIRNDVAYSNLKVLLVGVGSGKTYSMQGYSHYGIEDGKAIALLPNFKVFSPENNREIQKALNEAFQSDGPVYLRLKR